MTTLGSSSGTDVRTVGHRMLIDGKLPMVEAGHWPEFGAPSLQDPAIRVRDYE